MTGLLDLPPELLARVVALAVPSSFSEVGERNTALNSLALTCKTFHELADNERCRILFGSPSARLRKIEQDLAQLKKGNAETLQREVRLADDEKERMDFEARHLAYLALLAQAAALSYKADFTAAEFLAALVAQEISTPWWQLHTKLTVKKTLKPIFPDKANRVYKALTKGSGANALAAAKGIAGDPETTRLRLAQNSISHPPPSRLRVLQLVQHFYHEGNPTQILQVLAENKFDRT